MLLDLQKILSSLGLVSSLLKPIPIVGNIVPGLVDTVDNTLNSTLGGILQPLIGKGSPLGGLLGDGGPLGSLLGDGSPLGAITGDNGLLSSILLANISSILNNTDPIATNATATLTTINSTLNAFNLTLSPAAFENSTQVLASFNNVLLATGSSSNCSVTPYIPAIPLILEPFAPFDPATALIYRYRQQQSVNLGSWFVQEAWMNPSLFTCAVAPQQAEHDIAAGYGSLENARYVLERHWDEWIQEQDFQYLATIGINTVRLPIGYWSLGPEYCQGTDFEDVASVYTNAWPRVVRAINWAAKYGLGILVDLHGAPGSQNGQAHSGISTGQVNFFNNASNIEKTIQVLGFLTEQLVGVNNVVGIELLNEPIDDPSLPAFYDEALETLRANSTQAAAFPFYIQDAFNLEGTASYIANRTDFLVEDHHSYFVFAPQNPDEPATELAVDVATTLSGSFLSTSTQVRRNLVIDEWSCALSAQSLENSTNPDADRQNFCTAQLQAYTNDTAGWSFWAYKTENCSDDPNWCFTGRVGTSLPTQFWSYPNGSSLAQGFNASQIETSPSEFFAFGSGSAALQGLNTPDSATLLIAASQGASGTNNFATVNEFLSTSPIDQSAVSSSAGVKRSGQHSFDLDARRRHRFSARHDRAVKRQNANTPLTSGTDFTPQQSAIAQGYADGFKAAKSFALFSGSRLGFTGQFVMDALASSSTIAPANQALYETWFMSGLTDGEVQVLNTLQSVSS